MSSSFFYSQDHDCSVCSPSLHPALLSPSHMSSWEDVSSIIDFYWDDEEPMIEEKGIEAITTSTPTTQLVVSSRPSAIPVRQNKTSSDHHSLASSASSCSEATSNCSPNRSSPATTPLLLSSSASTMTSTSSSSSSSSSFFSSRRLRLSKRKAISNRSLRQRKPALDIDIAPRSARSLDDGRTPPPTLLLPPIPRNTSSMDGDNAADAAYGTPKHNGIHLHPYNFFEASLYMSPDYSILEDGWLRLSLRSKTTESRLR